jgi:pimeloyl-ACP methyl ester carboxylesterase
MKYLFLFLLLSTPLFAQENGRQQTWPASCSVVEIVSSKDGVIQRAYMHASNKPGKQPLVVSLHSWSGGYDQQDELLALALEYDLNYIHPNFRGPNNNPAACGSDLVLSDLDDAITFALQRTQPGGSGADPAQIHVMGGSGGGYATLLMYMRSKHPLASCSAFVPISDLESWFYESVGRKQKYYRDLLAVTQSPDSLHFNGAEARRRSPLFMPTPTKARANTPLLIAAGIHDGYQGSVPITHTLRMFNKVATDLGAKPRDLISTETMLRLTTQRTWPGLPRKQFGGRQLIYEKVFQQVRVVIFEGAHQTLPSEAYSNVK